VTRSYKYAEDHARICKDDRAAKRRTAFKPRKSPNNDTAAAVMEEKMQYFAEVCCSLLGQAEYLQKVNSTMIQVVS
jgi:hypothetical protein